MFNQTKNSAGFASLSAYLPAKKLTPEYASSLVNYLKEKTQLPKEYIAYIEKENKLPGSIENNDDGWRSKPWFQAWVDNMPEKKRQDPFQGTKERRRVPMDPDSIRKSIHPHPMLPTDAETLAGAMAICNSKIKPDDIDLVIAHSQVPDHPLPQNVSLIQHKLGLKNAGAYGIDSCCSSFVTMTEIASSLVMSGIKKNVLIVASFLDSHVTDRSDYFSVNTGDAAVAAIVSSVPDGYGFLSSFSISHGSRHDGVIYQRRSPSLLKKLDSGPDYSQMFITFHNPIANKEIAKNAASDLSHVVHKSLERIGMSIDDVDFLATHQPVAWAGNVWREAIGLPEHKFHQTFEKYGNIANCSAIVNLLESIELGLIKKDHNVIFTSSGAGENQISIIMKITPELVNEISKNALNEKKLEYEYATS